MAITLRTVTGSALSHTQLDTNFSSYFYSASVSASVLDLHYTGSAGIGLLPRSTSINLPSSSKWSDIVGGGISRNSEVQITGSTNISGSTSIVGTLAQGFPGVQASNFSHAEGYFSIASGAYSHAEGYQAVTSGSYSHAEGRETTTKAVGSHAEGYLTVASGSYSHAEGEQTVAIGIASHAEGTSTQAVGDYSHAEGYFSIASGSYSHAEGRNTTASAQFAHAEGFGTVAAGRHQHVQGQYNLSSSAESAFIIGNGTADNARRNLVFASGSQFQVSGSLNVSGAINTVGNLTVQGNITAQQYIVSTSVYFVTESFFSGSHIFGNSSDDTHQFTGSVLVQGDLTLSGSGIVSVGSQTSSTSSYSMFRDDSGRLQIGNLRLNTFGAYGIKINTDAKVQLSQTQRNYGLYDTTLNIIGSGSQDGITMTQFPDATNRYTITVQSGSQYKMNFRNSLHPNSGSFDFSGSVAIISGSSFFLNGTKQFNHAMFSHTASVSVANGTSGSVPLSVTTVAEGVSIVSGSRITVANPGDYNIQFSAQLAQGAGTANIYIWFKKNGVNIANTTSANTLAGNSNELMTVNIIDYAASAGDYYEIAHQSNAANSSLEYIAASGNIPAAPAIIVTVAQVG